MPRTTPPRKVLFISLVILLITSQACIVPPEIIGGTSNGPEGKNVSDLAIDPATPTTLYAGTHDSGVFKSTDGGETWSAVNVGLTYDYHVQALAIDPATPTTLYAGTLICGVFKSMNGGGSWSATSLDFGSVNALAIDPATPTTLYAGTGDSGVLQSTNGGGDWSMVSAGLPIYSEYYFSVDSLTIDPATPTTLYATISGHGVFKSTNGGGTLERRTLILVWATLPGAD